MSAPDGHQCLPPVLVVFLFLCLLEIRRRRCEYSQAILFMFDFVGFL
nr:MAG TPA: hypothetical protein [Microviridae sp.]